MSAPNGHQCGVWDPGFLLRLLSRSRKEKKRKRKTKVSSNLLLKKGKEESEDPKSESAHI
jgi:hypothetical protein